MKLSPEDVHLFYKLYPALLQFVNERYNIVDAVSSAQQLISLPPEDRYQLRERLFENDELIDEFVKKNPQKFPAEEIAIVFGSERSGMSNEEMDHCQFQIHIPANEAYSSLNLAASVQVLGYELRMAQLLADGDDVSQPEEELARRDEMERFYDHLFQVMQAVGYYRPEQPKLLRRRVRKLFNRPMMSHAEVQIMRGFLSMIEQSLPSHSQNNSDV